MLVPGRTPCSRGALGAQIPRSSRPGHGVLAFTFQIYFDFSGYTDMALGVGADDEHTVAAQFQLALPGGQHHRLLAPLAHDLVALSARLRLYPARWQPAGQRGVFVNLMLTMLSAGSGMARHGPMLAWGGLHWVASTFSRTMAGAISGSGRSLPFPHGFYLLLAVITAWVFFRASDFASAANIVKGLFGMNGAGDPIPGAKKATGLLARCGRACRDRAPAELPADHAALHAGARAGRAAERPHGAARLGAFTRDGGARRRRDHRRRALLLGHDRIPHFQF